MLNTYEEFLVQVEELGLLAFTPSFLPGFPSLQDFVTESQWHTGDQNADPWQWKDRAAREKRLAFGCVLGGAKGFIARRLYPLFVAACRPEEDLETRFSHGTVSRSVMELRKLFTPGAVLDTSEIRQRMGVKKGKGFSKTDSAMVTLQREFVIAVCGNRRKTGKDGREYGWPINTYCLMEDWAGDWLTKPLPGKQEARELLYDHFTDMPGDFDLDRLETLLYGKG